MKTDLIDIEKLHLYKDNPREIKEGQFQKLKKSLKEFGFVKPLVVNVRKHESFTDKEKGKLTILGGNMRYRAARQLGCKNVPIFKVNLDKHREKMLNIGLNRITGEWDVGKLEKLVYELSDEELDLDLAVTGLEDWELRIYNPAEDEEVEDIEKIVGETEKATYVLRLVFKEEEDILKATEALTGKSNYRTMVRGEKLLNLLEKYEKEN